ncbi:hypothetical protein DCC62_08260 [candidate division KSB1 bacterium]|nr:MAG: hypothetical protein DCC62_08260 [candidate division KSB1 bacterium]
MPSNPSPTTEAQLLQEFYNTFAAHYDSFYELIDYETWAALIQRELDEWLPRSRCILEAGCGTGAVLQEIAGNPRQTCIGADISRAMLDICQKKSFVKQCAALVQSDLLSLSFQEASFDAVLGIFSLLNSYSQAARGLMLQEIRRVLKPGGIFLTDFATAHRYHELRAAAERHEETSHSEPAFNLHQIFPAEPEIEPHAQTETSLHDRFVIDRTLTTNKHTARHRLYFFEAEHLAAEFSAAVFEILKIIPLLHHSSAPAPNRLMLIGRKPCSDSTLKSSMNVSRNFVSKTA